MSPKIRFPKSQIKGIVNAKRSGNTPKKPASHAFSGFFAFLFTALYAALAQRPCAKMSRN